MYTPTGDNKPESKTALKKGFKQLVAEAKSEVQTYTPADVTDRVGDDDAVFVDVREMAEVVNNGQIPGAVHAPRGMLEFHIDPENPYYMEQFGDDREFIFYCAVGGRSALAARTAKEMGLTNVASVDGGFNAWKESGGSVEEPRPTMV